MRIKYLSFILLLITQLAYSEGTVNRLIEDISFNPKTSTLSYRLNNPAYIRVRVGIKEGPLYGTPVDWEYRDSGRHEENWEDIKKDVGAFVNYEELIYTINSFTIDDTDKKLMQLEDIMVHPAQLAMGRALETFRINEIHKCHNRLYCHEPKVKIILPEGIEKSEEGIPIINGSTPIKIDIGETLKQFYTIHIFFDNLFIHGELIGYTPYTYYIASEKLKPGMHLITININTFDDHIGVDKILVRVEK